MNKPVILCVDDEQAILNSLNRQLMREFGHDYEFEFAESGEEGLEIIDELHDDGFEVVMVISDQIMPGLKGDEFLAELHQRDPSIIKILLTGQAALSSAVYAINQANLFRYLTKPWDEQDFLLTVKKGLEEYYLISRLEEQVTQLKKLDKLKDDFLANTSHELRTPLHGIIGLAESLIDGASGQLNDTAKADLAMVVSSGKRLAGLVNDILDFSKLKNQSLDIDCCPLDLKALTDVVFAVSKPLLGRRRLQLVNAISPKTPLVHADENRVQQILYNLIGNAIKFTDQGYIEVSAQVARDNMLEVRIKDTGVGVPKDKFEDIFGSFQQVDGSTARAHGGTGLGLAITRQLVELHGGSIYIASSTVGEGSVFAFCLPLSKEVEAKNKETETVAMISYQQPSEEVAIADEYDDAQFRILAVDDEPVNLKVLLNFLSLKNYHMTQASSGQEALKALEQEPRFDLVLLDVMMPHMSGYEVCEKIREHYAVQELPVIFLTAKNQVSDLVAAFSAGGNDYLSKPVTKNELLARVRTHLQLLESNRTLEKKVAERTQDLKWRNSELETLDSIVKTINRELILQTVLQTVLDQGCVLFPQADRGLLLLWNDKKEYFQVFAQFGYQEEELTQLDYSPDQLEAFLGNSEGQQKLQQGVYLYHNLDVNHEKGITIENEISRPKSLLSMSLGIETKTLGYLILGNYTSTEAFDHSDVQKLGRFREHAISAVTKSRLLQELQDKNNEIMRTQKKMIMQEKLASLGTLTAGVAHEIKNPLNFVNNFASLSIDLSKELRGELDKAKFKILDEHGFQELNEILKEIEENAVLINESGQRANGIVQSMMALARGGRVTPQPTDINQLLDEFTNLAVHGKTTTEKKINLLIHRDYDKSIPALTVVAQDLSRVFINLITNAVEAMASKKERVHASYQPTLWINTKDREDHVEIIVRDNGPGVPENCRDDIFSPFFTTKPTGQGNIGLGLSLSFEIVVDGHSGEFKLDTEEGEYTQFTICLPKEET